MGRYLFSLCSVSCISFAVGAVIEENVEISHAIVGENVIVKKNAVISRGCILTNGAIIGEGVQLPEFTRICMKRPADKVNYRCGRCTLRLLNLQNGESNGYDVELVGNDGVGYAWSYEGGDDYDVEIEGRMNIDEVRSASLGCHEEETLRALRWCQIPEPEDEEEDDFDQDIMVEDTRARNDATNFVAIIADMVASGLRSNDLPENILMEVKGFKFAQNLQFSDCIVGAVPPLLHHIAEMGISKKQFVSYSMQFFSGDGKGATILQGLCQDEEDEYALHVFLIAKIIY